MLEEDNFNVIKVPLIQFIHELSFMTSHPVNEEDAISRVSLKAFFDRNFTVSCRCRVGIFFLTVLKLDSKNLNTHKTESSPESS